jgi:hypothetical protein
MSNAAIGPTLLTIGVPKLSISLTICRRRSRSPLQAGLTTTHRVAARSKRQNGGPCEFIRRSDNDYGHSVKIARPQHPERHAN